MNFDVLTGHKNAVVQVEWSADGQTIYSASADKTLGFWDFIVRTLFSNSHHLNLIEFSHPFIDW